MAIQLKVESDSTRAQSDLAKLRSSVNGITTAISPVSGGMVGLQRSVDNIGTSVSRASSMFSTFAMGITAVVTAFSALRGVIGISDSITRFDTQLKLVTHSAGEFAQAIRDTANIAIDSRASIEGVAVMYAKISRASAELGVSQKQVALFTQNVSRAMTAGGESAQQNAAALMQLGQALGSNRLQGDELRSILENAPILAQQIAKGLNVTIGQMRILGMEGKLTAGEVFRAILNQTKDINTEFAKVNVTFSGAFQNMGNAIFLLYKSLSGIDLGTGSPALFINNLAISIAKFANGLDTTVNKKLIDMKIKFLLFSIDVTEIFYGMYDKLPVIDFNKIFPIGEIQKAFSSLPSVKSLIDSFVTTVYKSFAWLYDVLLGHSVIPDIVLGIGWWLTKLLLFPLSIVKDFVRAVNLAFESLLVFGGIFAVTKAITMLMGMTGFLIPVLLGSAGAILHYMGVLEALGRKIKSIFNLAREKVGFKVEVVEKKTWYGGKDTSIAEKDAKAFNDLSAVASSIAVSAAVIGGSFFASKGLMALFGVTSNLIPIMAAAATSMLYFSGALDSIGRKIKDIFENFYVKAKNIFDHSQIGHTLKQLLGIRDEVQYEYKTISSVTGIGKSSTDTPVGVGPRKDNPNWFHNIINAFPENWQIPIVLAMTALTSALTLAVLGWSKASGQVIGAIATVAVAGIAINIQPEEVSRWAENAAGLVMRILRAGVEIIFGSGGGIFGERGFGGTLAMIARLMLIFSAGRAALLKGVTTAVTAPSNIASNLVNRSELALYDKTINKLSTRITDLPIKTAKTLSDRQLELSRSMSGLSNSRDQTGQLIGALKASQYATQLQTQTTTQALRNPNLGLTGQAAAQLAVLRQAQVNSDIANKLNTNLPTLVKGLEGQKTQLENNSSALRKSLAKSGAEFRQTTVSAGAGLGGIFGGLAFWEIGGRIADGMVGYSEWAKIGVQIAASLIGQGVGAFIGASISRALLLVIGGMGTLLLSAPVVIGGGILLAFYAAYELFKNWDYWSLAIANFVKAILSAFSKAGTYMLPWINKFSETIIALAKTFKEWITWKSGEVSDNYTGKFSRNRGTGEFVGPPREVPEYSGRFRRGSTKGYDPSASVLDSIISGLMNSANAAGNSNPITHNSGIDYRTMSKIDKFPHIDMEKLLDAVKHVESRGRLDAVSPKGAQGPYQFMPDTAKRFKLENPFDETQSRRAAKEYLESNLKMFSGDLGLALAGYNWGEERVQRNQVRVAAGGEDKTPLETQRYQLDVIKHYVGLLGEEITHTFGEARKFEPPEQKGIIEEIKASIISAIDFTLGKLGIEMPASINDFLVKLGIKLPDSTAVKEYPVSTERMPPAEAAKQPNLQNWLDKATNVTETFDAISFAMNEMKLPAISFDEFNATMAKSPGIINDLVKTIIELQEASEKANKSTHYFTKIQLNQVASALKDRAGIGIKEIKDSYIPKTEIRDLPLVPANKEGMEFASKLQNELLTGIKESLYAGKKYKDIIKGLASTASKGIIDTVVDGFGKNLLKATGIEEITKTFVDSIFNWFGVLGKKAWSSKPNMDSGLDINRILEQGPPTEDIAAKIAAGTGGIEEAVKKDTLATGGVFNSVGSMIGSAITGLGRVFLGGANLMLDVLKGIWSIFSEGSDGTGGIVKSISELFSGDGIVAKMFSGLFGADGILSGLFKGVFGAEGLLGKAFSGLFGEGSFLGSLLGSLGTTAEGGGTGLLGIVSKFIPDTWIRGIKGFFGATEAGTATMESAIAEMMASDTAFQATIDAAAGNSVAIDALNTAFQSMVGTASITSESIMGLNAAYDYMYAGAEGLAVGTEAAATGLSGLMGSIGAAMPYIGGALLAAQVLGVFDENHNAEPAGPPSMFRTMFTATRGGMTADTGGGYSLQGRRKDGGEYSDNTRLSDEAISGVNSRITKMFDDYGIAALSAGLSTNALSGAIETAHSSLLTGSSAQETYNNALNSLSDNIAIALIPNLNSLKSSSETLSAAFARVTGTAQIAAGINLAVSASAPAAPTYTPQELWFLQNPGYSITSALGNIFNSTGVSPFAKGGTFSNSIVSSPTLFKFAGGTGLMGEAGSEAIMPLTRGAGGRLGVSASGFGGDSGESSQVINFYITGDVSRQTRTEILSCIPIIANGVNAHNREKGRR